MAAIEVSWNRIHQWMDLHSPNMRQLLNYPVQPSEIYELEHEMQLGDDSIPADFKLSYTSNTFGHNGSSAKSFFGSTNISFKFYTTDDILHEWQDLKFRHGPENDNAPIQRAEDHEDDYLHPQIKDLMWSERWIPFGGKGGDCICIDLDPVDTINRGQVIRWFKNGKYPILEAPNFAFYLHNFANDMEDGKYSLSQDGRELIFTEHDNDP